MDEHCDDANHAEPVVARPISLKVYGHNGADDVALDAALLARAVAGRPVRLQRMRDDEFACEPYGSAMLMRAKTALDANGPIVDWLYEVWSNTHSTRPAAPGEDNNLLASWYLIEPSKPGPPTNIPQPAGGGDRNAVPLYDFPSQRVVNHLITIAGAFVARWCVGSKPATAGGVFQVREDKPAPRIGAGPHRTP